MSIRSRAMLVRAGVLVCAALVALGGGGACAARKDPIYKGRRISAWIEDIGSKEKSKQIEACRHIAEFGPEAGAATSRLLALVGTADDEVIREEAARAIGALGVAAVPELRRAWRKPEVRPHAARALRYLDQGADLLLPDLIRDSDRHPGPEGDAARAGIVDLARTHNPDTYRVLMQYLRDAKHGEPTRLTVGRSMKSFPCDLAAAELVSLLPADDVVQRRAALLGLVRPYPDMLPVPMVLELIRHASDPDPACRIALALALGECRDPATSASVPAALLQLSTDPVPEVRFAAGRGIERYGQEDATARSEMAPVVMRLRRDEALGRFWMSPPPSYAAYF